MRTKYILLLVFTTFMVALLVLACSSPKKESLDSSFLRIHADYTTLRLQVGADNIFPLTLKSKGIQSKNITIKISTKNGADWKTILCTQKSCYIHDGITPLEIWISTEELLTSKFEIKFRVPSGAQSGDQKTIRLTLTLAEAPEISDSIELQGFVP